MKSRFWEFWTDPQMAPEIDRGRSFVLKSVITLLLIFAAGGGYLFYMTNRKSDVGTIRVYAFTDQAEIRVNNNLAGYVARDKPLIIERGPGVWIVKAYAKGFITELPDANNPSMHLRCDSVVITTTKGSVHEVKFAFAPDNNATSREEVRRAVPTERAESDRFPTPVSSSKSMHAQTALIQVESTPAGAAIIVDDQSTNRKTPALLELVLGVHRVNVVLEKYRTIDADKIVSLNNAGTTQTINFQLTPVLQADFGKLTIHTEPVEGTILVDGIEKGTGSVQLDRLPFGEYNVRFGTFEGYRTPPPRKVMLNSMTPVQNVRVAYEPLLSVGAWLDEKGSTRLNHANIVTGVSIDGNFQSDPTNGPSRKYFKDVNLWSWELGYGIPSKNPPGSDALMVTFSMPDGVDHNTLKLRLYGYGTNRKYPYTLTGKTRITVELNGKIVASEVFPSRNIDNDDPPGYDEWRIGNWLLAGENRLVIRTGDRSDAYYLLTRVVIL